MSIEARYPGTCPECDHRWVPGDLIRTDPEHGGWIHATCPDSDDLTPDHPICPSCWLAHPEGACDR